MDYKELVVKSFHLAWRYKWLWVFGVFAGGGGGFGGNFNTGSPSSWDTGTRDFRLEDFVVQAEGWIAGHLPLVIALIAVFLIFILLMIILSIISQGALVGAGARLDKDEDVGFGESLKLGLTNFWSVFGLGLLLVLVIILPITIIGGIVALIFAAIGAAALPLALLLMPLILLLIPALLAVAIIHFLGLRFIVIEGLGAVAALGEAWRLLWRRLGPVALVWLISAGLAIAFTLATIMVALILILPTALAAYLAFRTGFSLVKLGIFVFVGLIILSAMVVARGAFGAYQSVYWTLAFRQLRALDSADGPAPG